MAKNPIDAVYEIVNKRSGLPVLAGWFADAARRVCVSNRHFVSAISDVRFNEGAKVFSLRATVAIDTESGATSNKRLVVRYDRRTNRVDSRLQ